MIYYYDLHIHSILSFDADVLMTPNNIFNMAYLKKLDIIAVTDHNSTKQLKIMHELSMSYDILFVPGIELSLKEDVHVCCYFESIEDATSFDEFLDAKGYRTRYDECLENTQGITDINDQIVAYYPYDLSLNLPLSLLDLQEILQPFRHILICAHIDRKKHSALPFINDISVDGIELSSRAPNHFIQDNQLQNYKVLYNSDAHIITDINERSEKNKMELESLSIKAFFKYFNHG